MCFCQCRMCGVRVEELEMEGKKSAGGRERVTCGDRGGGRLDMVNDE